jgi:hypothetical protein
MSKDWLWYKYVWWNELWMEEEIARRIQNHYERQYIGTKFNESYRCVL